MHIRDINTSDIPKLGERKEQGIRQIRKPLLKEAYDAYKIAVCYGEIIETPQEHEFMLAWSQRLRDKDIFAMDEIPEKVKYYL